MVNKKQLAKKSHLDGSFFESNRYLEDVEDFLNVQLSSDIGVNGDITTETLGLRDQRGSCNIVAKEGGIFCGGFEVKYFLEECSSLDVEVDFEIEDGGRFNNGDVLVKLKGIIANIFMAERTVLNVLQRMSGIATLTKEFINKAGGEVLICPTRKTLLGSLDKKGCLCGGGGTHRVTLDSAILFKKTHLGVIKKDFSKVVNAVFSEESQVRFVECEVESVEDARTLLNLYEDKVTQSQLKQFVIMLDNIEPSKIKAFLSEVEADKSDVLFEASGGVTLDNIQEYADSGVDIISVGKLTNGVKPIDMSFRLSSLDN